MKTKHKLTAIPSSTSDLDIDLEVVELCKNMVNGLIVVSGNAGSGRSTLLSSLFNDQVKKPIDNISLSVIESPISFSYDSLKSSKSKYFAIDPLLSATSLSSSVLLSCRMGVDSILINNSIDSSFVDSVIKACYSGNLVFVKSHGGDIYESIERIISSYSLESRDINKEKVINSLSILINQKLIPDVNGKVVPIREYLILNDELRSYLINSQDLSLAVSEAIEIQGKTFSFDLEKKLENGIINKEIYLSSKKLVG